MSRDFDSDLERVIKSLAILVAVLVLMVLVFTARQCSSVVKQTACIHPNILRGVKPYGPPGRVAHREWAWIETWQCGTIETARI